METDGYLNALGVPTMDRVSDFAEDPVSLWNGGVMRGPLTQSFL